MEMSSWILLIFFWFWKHAFVLGKGIEKVFHKYKISRKRNQQVFDPSWSGESTVLHLLNLKHQNQLCCFVFHNPCAPVHQEDISFSNPSSTHNQMEEWNICEAICDYFWDWCFDLVLLHTVKITWLWRN